MLTKDPSKESRHLITTPGMNLSTIKSFRNYYYHCKLISCAMMEMKWMIKRAIARIEVRVGDINYGGHLGNDKALLVFHDARIAFLESLGFSEKNIGGPAIIMRDAHVTFRKEVFLHDVLTVDAGIDEVTLTSFNMVYTVKRESDGAVVFLGSTGLVAFDYDLKKVAKLPEVFLQKIRE